ncbi:hypothetical protein LM596_04290 [Liquorilactobacillus mali]|uniref:hypothetical protein n=1 Tax=Liquorilactobacillus mali TaxID=1618 RepID=UPI00024911DF|nr:hypothetical protein [Liquorilactobacillus mali]EJE99277.1 hypothetical protein LMA_06066 [Liquorilactobacillus mali KCTC 3596 = DSM 20444]QFQ74390.1 hypothetical protein LM596_04290 [Liquorilactobacillus mali]
MNESMLLLPQKYLESDKVHVLGIDVSIGKSSCALLHEHTIIRKFKIVHNKSNLSKLKSVIKKIYQLWQYLKRRVPIQEFLPSSLTTME